MVAALTAAMPLADALGRATCVQNGSAWIRMDQNGSEWNSGWESECEVGEPGSSRRFVSYAVVVKSMLLYNNGQ